MDEREMRANVSEGSAEKFEEAAEKVKSIGQQAKEKMKGAYESARGKVQETVEGIKGKSFDEIVDSTSQYVKDNPGRFLLITFGLGLVAGLMLRSGKKQSQENP